eukprot:scaffold21269_cov99-Amphora_coffeaeformis.AAC.1
MGTLVAILSRRGSVAVAPFMDNETSKLDDDLSSCNSGQTTVAHSNVSEERRQEVFRSCRAVCAGVAYPRFAFGVLARSCPHSTLFVLLFSLSLQYHI